MMRQGSWGEIPVVLKIARLRVCSSRSYEMCLFHSRPIHWGTRGASVTHQWQPSSTYQNALGDLKAWCCLSMGSPGPFCSSLLRLSVPPPYFSQHLSHRSSIFEVRSLVNFVAGLSTYLFVRIRISIRTTAVIEIFLSLLKSFAYFFSKYSSSFLLPFLF